MTTSVLFTNVRIIDGAGATLMPGMVEAHTHFSWNDAANLSDLRRLPLELKDGYLADLLLVDGDPLSNLAILRDPAKLLAVMKDGVFYKEPEIRSAQTRWGRSVA